MLGHERYQNFTAQKTQSEPTGTHRGIDPQTMRCSSDRANKGQAVVQGTSHANPAPNAIAVNKGRQSTGCLGEKFSKPMHIECVVFFRNSHIGTETVVGRA
jgi:hypothetical protein